VDEDKFRNRLAGGIRFPEDMTSKKMVYAILIRSPRYQGILEEVDVPKLPENMLFMRAKDLPGKNLMPLPDCALPLLVEDEVLYPGQPLGLLTGADPEILNKIGSQIRCRIRKTPPFPPAAINDPRSTAIIKEIKKGDLDRGMNKAEQILKGEYKMIMPEVPSYPRNNIFCTKEGGRYILHLHTQWPSLVRKLCALAANISRKQVELHFNTAGRTWDSHIWQSAVPAALTVAAASILRQPVRLIEEENIAMSFVPRELNIHYTAGLDHQGRLTALMADLSIDAGAYGCFASEVLTRLCLSSAGFYQCRNIRIRGKAYQTNTPPWFPMAGWGLPQGFFGVEMLANHLAEESGTDPAIWRNLNIVEKGNLYPTSGQVRQRLPLPEMVDDICRKSDFTRKHAAGRQVRQNERELDLLPTGYSGIGMAVSFQGNEFLSRNRVLTASSVTTTLHKEGNLEIILNAVPATPSLLALWKKRISKRLSIPEEQISFILDKPDDQAFSGPSTLSRSSTILTRLIDQSCDLIQKKRFREALPITETGSFRRRTKTDWDEESLIGTPFGTPSFAAAVVDVQLETATMELRVPKIWLSLNCGIILDKSSARSFIEAEVRLALCQCLKKQAIKPSIFPELHIEFNENESKNQRIGGLEGLVLGAVPAAFAQAVSLASGLQINSLPLESGDLLRGVN